MDYSIWSILETKACSKSHKSIESLKKSLVVEWEKVPQEVLRTAVEALPGRIIAAIKNKGGYIEAIHNSYCNIAFNLNENFQ